MQETLLMFLYIKDKDFQGIEVGTPIVRKWRKYCRRARCGEEPMGLLVDVFHWKVPKIAEIKILNKNTLYTAELKNIPMKLPENYEKES